MIPPSLLFINVDTCPPCVGLVSQKAEINRAIKERYPDMRCIWVALDNMNMNMIPSEWKETLKYFPFVIYYPRGVPAGTDDGIIMDLDAAPVKGIDWSSKKILNWLEIVVDPAEKCDQWMTPNTDTPINPAPKFVVTPISEVKSSNSELVTPIKAPKFTSEHKSNFTITAGPPGSAVMVFLMTENCAHCAQLTRGNAYAPQCELDRMVMEMSLNYPIRVCVVTKPTMGGKFDPKYPHDLNFYSKWFPSIILVPGSVFDAAMADPTAPMREGVQIYNGQWKGQTYEYVPKYTGRISLKNVEKWYMNAIAAPDFSYTQHGLPASKSKSETKSDAVTYTFTLKGLTYQLSYNITKDKLQMKMVDSESRSVALNIGHLMRYFSGAF